MKKFKSAEHKLVNYSSKQTEMMQFRLKAFASAAHEDKSSVTKPALSILQLPSMP
jgi:hypothetical protein